eukprot:GILI01006547.1.p1 GENE.GILI01006547.1~~GILI01006547.1.p1  ORF type:complete len:838 (-),score=118.97 GILI01006547.1:321-2834(-)
MSSYTLRKNVSAPTSMVNFGMGARTASTAMLLDEMGGKDPECCRVGEYTLLRQLGDGTYGTVFMATHNRTHEIFAIKRVTMDRQCMKAVERQVRREAAMMQGLHHPHVVRLIQILQTSDAFYFVMELAEGGELFDMVISSSKFTESMARKYFQQLISALHYCHGNDVIHRDLKAENLLLSRTGQLKVCDFGFSFHFKSKEVEEGDEDGDAFGDTECGTVDYMAPEYVSKMGGYGSMDGTTSNNTVLDPHAHDLWASGVILYFMLVGSLPFHGRCEEETLYMISHIPADLDKIDSEGAKRLLSKMLAMDPTDRPSIADILADPWFSVGLDHSMFTDSLGKSQNKLVRSSSRVFLDFSPNPSGEGIDALTDAENEKMQEAFSALDVDDDGTLTRDELRDAILELNRSCFVSANEVSTIIDCFVPNGQEGVSFEGFKRAWVERDVDHTVLKNFPYFRIRSLTSLIHAPVEQPLVRAVRNVFDQIDTNHDGKFNAKDVENLIVQHNSLILAGSTPAISTNVSPNTANAPHSNVSNPLAPAPITVDSTGIKELISYLDTNGTGTILFDEFLTGTARSNVLLEHRIGSQLAKIIPALSEVKSQLLLTGSRFTVGGSIATVTSHIIAHSPDRLRHDSSHESEGGVELLFELVRSGVDDSKACSAAQSFSSPLHHTAIHANGGGFHPTGAFSSHHSQAASSFSMPTTPPGFHVDSPFPSQLVTSPRPHHQEQLPSYGHTDSRPMSRQQSNVIGRSHSQYGLRPNHNSSLVLTNSLAGSPLDDGVTCKISVQLTQLREGFVAVVATRIAGSTMHFRDAISLVCASVEADRELAVNDMQPVGDSELM